MWTMVSYESPKCRRTKSCEWVRMDRDELHKRRAHVRTDHTRTELININKVHDSRTPCGLSRSITISTRTGERSDQGGALDPANMNG